MQRREFITLAGGAAIAWPLVARAQQPAQVRRIGMLIGYGENDPETQARLSAFRQGLEHLGWTEGRGLRPMSIASSRVKSRPIFPCRRRSSLSSSSICGLPKRSGSKSRKLSCCALTR
jgi:hypothetical protein